MSIKTILLFSFSFGNSNILTFVSFAIVVVSTVGLSRFFVWCYVRCVLTTVSCIAPLYIKINKNNNDKTSIIGSTKLGCRVRDVKQPY